MKYMYKKAQKCLYLFDIFVGVNIIRVSMLSLLMIVFLMNCNFISFAMNFGNRKKGKYSFDFR